MQLDAARAILAAPGSPFELTTEQVRGRTMRVFKQRRRSMRELVAQSADDFGDATFLVHGDRRISFRSFAELTWGSAQRLRTVYGLRPTDRVGILAINRPEWLIALFGAASAGAIVVGLNGWWHTEELEYALHDSGCRFLIVDDALYARVAPILDALDHLEHVFFIGKNPPAGTIAIDELLSPSSEIPTTPIEEDDPFVMLYTSGTTGRSKGCITTHRGTLAQVQSIFYNVVLGSMTVADAAPASSQRASVSLLTSPLFHVAGLHCGVCTALASGATLVFGPAKFEAEALLRLIETERVTTWVAIPTLLQRLLQHPRLQDFDLSSLTTVSTGGAPAAPELLAEASQRLPARPPSGTSYGLTECHGMASALVGREAEERRGSVGRITPILDAKIVDPEGRTLPAGQTGELCLFGVMITPGYWMRPQDTTETIRDGWLHTGDLGHLDADGYLYISDRAKDMIIRSGENVYCVEIENCLNDHPDIEEAAVIGVPDADRGERVKAIVRKRQGASIDALGVQAHVAQHLARFKVPEIVDFTDQPLPRNAAGKLLKNALRKAGR
jgi:long-chain acyl-CoA synthetase